MDDAFIVSGGKSAGNLNSVVDRFARGQRAGAHDLGEGFAFE